MYEPDALDNLDQSILEKNVYICNTWTLQFTMGAYCFGVCVGRFSENFLEVKLLIFGEQAGQRGNGTGN